MRERAKRRQAERESSKAERTLERLVTGADRIEYERRGRRIEELERELTKLRIEAASNKDDCVLLERDRNEANARAALAETRLFETLRDMVQAKPVVVEDGKVHPFPRPENIVKRRAVGNADMIARNNEHDALVKQSKAYWEEYDRLNPEAKAS